MLACALTARGVKTARGGDWSDVQVAAILRRYRALPGKERARQWRIVPAYAPAGIGDHLQRNMGRRKGVIEELALTR